MAAMADEHREDRQYDPTARRLEQAREEGNVARSPELASATVALAAASAAAMLGPAIFAGSLRFLGEGLRIPREAAFEPAILLDALSHQALGAAIAFSPWLLIMLVAGCAGPLLLSGGVLSAKALAPQASRLDPLAGLGRMFSMRSVGALAIAIAKCVLLGVIAWFGVAHALPDLARAGAVDSAAGVGLIGAWAATFGFALAGGILVIALADVPVRWWRHRRDLRMTREELREELRESDGDPHLKARIRSLQRDAARKRMMSAVPTATVVVTNPTHYAVALEYRESMRAPKVVAKGTDLVAQRIREIAAEHRVPTLEAPPLARALWKHADLGGEIPQALYPVVARLLAWVWQVDQAMKQGGAAPQRPDDLAVPPGLDPAAAS
jgi:flagellar biosynthetic protein FlhB